VGFHGIRGWASRAPAAHLSTFDLERPSSIKDLAGSVLARYACLGHDLVTKRESGNGIEADPPKRAFS
jgi:hypothetical protein